VTLEWSPLYEKLAGLLGRGLLVTCDYGFERSMLLDPRVRRHGTLACYRRQRVHRDALSRVGEQDLTAHVDFTTLVETGETRGLETVAFTRQARWLLACGLFDQLPSADQATRLQAMDLLAADGMGEEIRVLVQTRDLDVESVLDLALLGRAVVRDRQPS
jgi:SAM-dependent MidA family methyltransferase